MGFERHEGMTPELITRHAAPLPRYTSYPTANHFSNAVGPEEYRSWLSALPAGANLSIYLHIPYCQELCWYCGCSTKATRRYEPIAAYIEQLSAEIATVSSLVARPHRVSHIHWGGGSPDILTASDMARLAALLREAFVVDGDAEFAVEIDPRLLTRCRAEALAQAGVNRISIGVQDFEPSVQAAIGREQSFEQTCRVVETFRDRGIRSINIDLVYGLPHQSVDSVSRTIEQVLSLSPDRIAIFGYAHLPSRLKHQRLLPEAALPGPVERFEQARRLSELVRASGYAEIGIDHFARPADTLASKPLARNFQGYTTDQADALLGLGASAISKLPGGYAQNAVAVEAYGEGLARDGVATVRGHAMTADDRIRAAVVERLMCDFSFEARELEARFGSAARPMRGIAEQVVRRDADGFVERTGDGFRLTAIGRPFVRNIAAQFDSYLTADVAQRRHALSV